ncbi:hypothetical protein EW145_g4964, partial [Phellinidium pouzarii]
MVLQASKQHNFKMDISTASRTAVDREKASHLNVYLHSSYSDSFHRVDFFEDGTLPTTDEHQIFTWKDATLKEVLTSLRLTAPKSSEIRHPLAKFAFRALYADSTARGRIALRELGMVYSRDILGEPGSLTAPAPRLLADAERVNDDHPHADRSLDELRFVPGDYMCVSVILPKHIAGAGVAMGPDVAIRGAAAGPGAGIGGTNGWKSA